MNTDPVGSSFELGGNASARIVPGGIVTITQLFSDQNAAIALSLDQMFVLMGQHLRIPDHPTTNDQTPNDMVADPLWTQLDLGADATANLYMSGAVTITQTMGDAQITLSLSFDQARELFLTYLHPNEEPLPTRIDESEPFDDH